MIDSKEVETSRAVCSAIKEHKIELERIIKKLEQGVLVAPKGGLRVLRRKNSFQYYWRKKSQDVNGIYIPKSEMKTAIKLAQRDYDQKVLVIAKEELSIISSYESLIRSKPIENVIEQFNEGRRCLINPIVISDKNIKKISLYEQSGYHAGNNMILTFESSQVPLNSNIIKNKIEQYLM
ncbi:hypothetical protein [Butyrivibrio proteoclasticus]|uniref:hypothetical protein n=1 Tax=Butyrivibrio proteoclasticus TaxID=43305 RepID=UPI00047BF212|nr:hypothetical protein [Butyrivibrio proteoclasticus]